MLNKAVSWSQKRILFFFFMLQVIVFSFAVNRFRATVEWSLELETIILFLMKVFESCMLIFLGQ